MIRAVVKNTFVALEAKEEGDEVDRFAGAGLPSRARSADVVGSRRDRAASGGAALRGEHLVHSLNRILTTGQPVEPLPAAEDPSVQELRSLQRRLSELIAQSPPSARGFCPCRLGSRLLSATAPDEAATGEPAGKLRHALSSGSVSTMTSEREAESHCGGTDDASNAARDRVHNQEEFSNSSEVAPITTLMIHNIPGRYSQRDLINELNALGFCGSYDFLCLPMGKGTKTNAGHAFVNFTDFTWAERCMNAFIGHRFKKFQKRPSMVAAVSIAHIQGLEANVQHWERSTVSSKLSGHGRSARPVIKTKAPMSSHPL